MWWFTADQHFDHLAIMDYCKRPFNTPVQMANHMVEAWNDHVHGKDVVVIAGDVSLHPEYKYVWGMFLGRLRGSKIVIRGNHDRWDKDKRYLYHKKLLLDSGMPQGIAVSHYPMRSWKNSNYGWWNLHGHSHGMMEPLVNQFDVGVDVAYREFGSYRPFSIEEINVLIK